MKIAFLGTYLPRKCGIATFTFDLRKSLVETHGVKSCPVIALTEATETRDYPAEVVYKISDQKIESYELAAEFINRSDIDVICLQHEFGIFGGKAGTHVIALLRALRKPIVTTLHTLLAKPDAEHRKVIEMLIELSERLVVMTERGRTILQEVYNAPLEKIDLIPHGIHDVPFLKPESYKELLRVKNRLVLLTFGLLSPNKGIENVIRALPAIIREHPSVVYMILGATHPNLVREHGENYRISLEQLAVKNNVAKHVIFYNRFVELDELTEFIGAADIYITPYISQEQVVSGTLAYAFGAGKAVISTPYWHAVELLSNGKGIIIPFADNNRLAAEVSSLLTNDIRREYMQRCAYESGRDMTWKRVAERYYERFILALSNQAHRQEHSLLNRTLAHKPLTLPPFNPSHILRMSDSTGIMQHAIYTIPNYHHGYCIDDNARALILTQLWRSLGESFPGQPQLESSYLAFLAYALHPESKRFRNFMGFDRVWNESEGSEDSHGRAMWALGVCVGHSNIPGQRLLAEQLFRDAIPPAIGLMHPRTWAFILLGLDPFLLRYPNDQPALDLRAILVEKIMNRFAEHSRGDWHWLADDATYVNARLTHGLMISGHALNDNDVFDTGLRALHWLIKIQTSATETFQPIGSDGFYNRDGTRAFYDQQPIEVQATMSACLFAFRVTRNQQWLKRAKYIFDWFLGRNDLDAVIYDAKSGGCRDALHVDRVNENQGAESTIAFHLAHAEMRLAINENTVSQAKLPHATNIEQRKHSVLSQNHA